MAAANSTRPATAGDVRDPLHPICQRIEAERRRLQKASAVLACLVYSANHDAPDIDAGDVASVVRDLIDRAVLALDAVDLQRKI